MDAKTAQIRKAEVEADLLDIEQKFAQLSATRDALRAIVSGYDVIIQADVTPSLTANLPISIVTVAEGTELPPSMVPFKPRDSVPSRFSNDNMTVRVKRILGERPRQYLTARQILEALEAEGWTTKSANKISIVRNTISDLAKRIPELDKKDLNDGTVGYGWVPANLASVADHEEAV